MKNVVKKVIKKFNPKSKKLKPVNEVKIKFLSDGTVNDYEMGFEK